MSSTSHLTKLPTETIKGIEVIFQYDASCQVIQLIVTPQPFYEQYGELPAPFFTLFTNKYLDEKDEKYEFLSHGPSMLEGSDTEMFENMSDKELGDFFEQTVLKARELSKEIIANCK